MSLVPSMVVFGLAVQKFLNIEAKFFEGIGMYVVLVYRWKDLDEQDLIEFLFDKIWIQNVGY